MKKSGLDHTQPTRPEQNCSIKSMAISGMGSENDRGGLYAFGGFGQAFRRRHRGGGSSGGFGA